MKHLYADIGIIGGGASGLAAAIGAAESDTSASIIIAERLDRTGKKILATGNGRCNLSNKKITAEAYHGTVKSLMTIIDNTPSAEDFFSGLGVLCTADSQGRMYPYSNSAATVLNALRLRISQLDVKEVCNFEVKKILPEKDGYILSSDNSEIKCRRIIIAAGGYAAPSFGTDGSVTHLLKDMGYKTSKICPAVAPLRVNPKSVRGLKGVRVKGNISAVSGDKILRTEKGEIQFTENTVSGICVFNLAYLFSEYEGRLSLRADLMPDMSLNELEEYLFCIQGMRYNSCIQELLTGLFASNIAGYIIRNTLADRTSEDKISSLKYNEIRSIAAKIKCLEFEVTGCSPWQNAQATSGGVHGRSVDEKLESRLHKGMYFCGEILDTDGDCGGYNLQWAWSSGLWAGRNCALSLKTEAEK